MLLVLLSVTSIRFFAFCSLLRSSLWKCSVLSHSSWTSMQAFWKLWLELTKFSNPSLLPQVYEALEQRLVIAESAQRLRLPLIAKDGELPDEDMEKWSIISRSSFDSSSTTSISTNTTVTSIMTSSTTPSTFFLGGTNPSELADPGIGGPVHRMLGLTPTWFRQSQLMHAPFTEVRLLSANLGLDTCPEHILNYLK